MKRTWWILALVLIVGCAGPAADYDAPAEETAVTGPQVEYQEPEPMAVPEYQKPESEEDWAARVNNKDKEVIETLNIINPVAVYITAGFEQYSDKFSPTLKEEWEDTQVQLTAAMTLYEDCKSRRAAGSFDKQLFLDLEEVWQLLVKTGVAGVRTKSMVDAELQRSAS